MPSKLAGGGLPVLLASLVVLVLVVAAATAVSFVRRDSITWGHAHGIYSIQLDRGTVLFFDYTRAGLAHQRLAWTVLPPGAGERTGRWFLGFVLHRWSASNPIFFVGVPLWPVCVMAGVASVVLLKSVRRAGRARRCLCTWCGYDLRASAERCPECGTLRDERSSPPHKLRVGWFRLPG